MTSFQQHASVFIRYCANTWCFKLICVCLLYNAVQRMQFVAWLPSFCVTLLSINIQSEQLFVTLQFIHQAICTFGELEAKLIAFVPSRFTLINTSTYIERQTLLFTSQWTRCLYSSPTDLRNTRSRRCVLILNTQTEWLDSRFTVNLRLLRHLNLQLWYCGDFSFEFNTQCVLWKECIHEEALACLHHLGGWGTNWWNSRYTTQPELYYVVGPLTIFPMHSLQYMVPQEQNVLHIITSLYLQLAWGMKTQNVATLIPCYCGFQSWQASVSVNKQQPKSP